MEGETLLEELVGMEVTGYKPLKIGGFALLFDEGYILIITSDDHVSLSTGPGGVETWDSLT